MSFAYEFGPLLTIDERIGPNAWYTLISKPDSEKRIKPADLFANATGRSTYSAKVSNNIYPVWEFSDGSFYYDFLSTGASFDFSYLSTECLEEARGKLLDKIKRQNVNLAQAMVEFRQTADLFLSLSQELLQGWRALRRLHFGELYRDLKRSREFSKKWIEFQFGLLPLVSDIEGLANSLHDKLRDGSWIHVEQSVTKTERKSNTRSDPAGNGKLIDDGTCMHTAKLKARYKIQDEFIDDLKRFGFSNAAALGWEVIPFSFVVDWAIGIGDWLNRLDALTGTSELIVNQSYSETLTYQTTSERNGATSSFMSITRGRAQSANNLPLPFPRYDPSKSLRKIVTGLSLIRLLGR